MISESAVQTQEPASPREKRSLYEDSKPLLADAAVLRARGERDGYLFFKGLLPAEPLLELRRQMLAICAERGWLSPWDPGLLWQKERICR